MPNFDFEIPSERFFGKRGARILDWLRSGGALTEDMETSAEPIAGLGTLDPIPDLTPIFNRERSTGLQDAMLAASVLPIGGIAKGASKLRPRGSGLTLLDLKPTRGSTSTELRALQQSTLSDKVLQKAHDAGKNNPEFRSAAAHMTPMELEKTVATGGNVETVSRLLQVLPKESEMAALAKAGSPKRGWYRASAQALVDIFGEEDAPRFAGLLAATSPQTSVESNLQNALKIWENWTKHGRPTDSKAIKAIMGMSVQGKKGEDSVLEAWLGNTVIALQSADPRKATLSGPKVNSFRLNLTDDLTNVRKTGESPIIHPNMAGTRLVEPYVYPVTNDAWIANVTGIDQGLVAGAGKGRLHLGDPGYSPGYIATSARIRQGAQKAGMFPSEGQETIWSVAMPLYEAARKRGMTPQQFLDAGLLTPELIRGTPDFSTLFKDPKYANILRQGGYEKQLEAMRSHQWPEENISLSLSEQRDLDKAAGRLGSLMGQRKRESFAASTPKLGQTRATVYNAHEPGSPYENSGHMTGMNSATPSQKQTLASDYGGVFKNEKGTDILNESAGMKTLGTNNMRGLWQADGQPLVSNPGYAAGVEVPLIGGRKTPEMYQQDVRRLNSVNALKAGMTVQGGVPANGMVRSDEGNGFFVKLKKRVKDQNMVNAGNAKAGDVVAADTGGNGVMLFPWSDRVMDKPEADTLSNLLRPGDKITRSKADPYWRGQHIGNMDDFSDEWKAPQGSGAVTTKMMTRLDELEKYDSPAYNKLDRDVREIAGDIHDLNVGHAEQYGAPREDVQRMLGILRDGGITALRQALKAGVALPVVMAVYDHLLNKQPEEQSAGPY